MPDDATLLTIRIPDFQAAVRKAATPQLHDRPVAIATSFKPLGRILAACPAARQSGVVPEMPYPAAHAKCPEAAFLLPDRDLDARAMDRLAQTALSYSPLVEPAEGGAILLDTRGTERLWGTGMDLAHSLQQAIAGHYGLPAAAGLAARKPWSILASRAAGHDGICHVRPGDEEAFLDQVPIAWVPGITSRTRTRLLELNLRRLGQLRRFGHGELAAQFGAACGEALWSVLHPRPWDGVAAPDQRADDAVRVEAALAEATAEAEKLAIMAAALAEQVAATLRSRNLGTGRLTLTLLHADGVAKTAQARTGGFIQDEAIVAAIVQNLLAKVSKRRVRTIRLWLAAERLSAPERQGSLFPAEPARPSLRRLHAALDGIHRRHGPSALLPAARIA